MNIRSILIWGIASLSLGLTFLWLANWSLVNDDADEPLLPEAKETIVLSETAPPEPGAPESNNQEVRLTAVDPAELGAGVPTAPARRVNDADPGSIVPPQEQVLSLVFEDQAVDWDASRQHPKMDLGRLDQRQIDAIRSAPVPVLLPDDQALLDAAYISTGDYFYAAAMNQDEHSVLVSASNRVASALPEGTEPPQFGDHGTNITRSEGIVTMSFRAFGTYYTIDVECLNPMQDPRCVQDAFVLKVADNLLHAAPP